MRPSRIHGIFFVLLSWFLLFSQPGKATHIVGGEFNYADLGGGYYRLSLTIYRDCYNGIAPFDDVAYIGIFDNTNTLISSDGIPLNDSAYIPNLINSPCLEAPTNICVQVGHYYKTIYLPPRPGGYLLAYQRCCRNYTIANLQNVNSTGATYVATIPGPERAAVNSNPVFTNLPPTFLCAGVPFSFDHSAVDADGDSLVYSLCYPYNGGSPNDPRPDPPSNPPYSPVVFQPPYSVNNPMGGVPMAIQAQTGLLTLTPADIGQYVYGICVREYRDGLLIGETRRDFQANVVYCNNYTVASIFSPTLACGTLEAHFQNTSYGASTFHWDFGVTSSTSDTSSEVHPVFQYPDTGTYRIMLIAYSGINPDCNDTAFGTAYVYPQFNADFSILQNPCSPDIAFADLSNGQYGNAKTWWWNFGDNTFSTAQNPAHTYLQPGNFTITLVAARDSGCSDTLKKTIVIKELPVSNFSMQLDTCERSVRFLNQSTYATSFSWTFGDGGTSQQPFPVHVYNASGTFSIALIASDSAGCTDTIQQSVTIPIVPVAAFTYDARNCDSLVRFYNQSQNASSIVWSFGDNSYAYINNPVHLYNASGTFTVLLQAISPNVTCISRTTQQVTVNRKPVAGFSAALDTCTFTFSLKSESLFADFFTWNFSDGTNDTGYVLDKKFDHDGTIFIELMAHTLTGCTDTTKLTTGLPPLPVADFTWNYSECDSIISFNQASVHADHYAWNFGDETYSVVSSPVHQYLVSGNIPVQLIAFSEFGCADTISKTPFIVIHTLSGFTSVIDSCSGIVYFKNTAPAAANYFWSFGDGSVSVSPDPVHSYSNNGNYPVTLIVNHETACPEVKEDFLKFELPEGVVIYAPTVFTPNNDGVNDRFTLSAFRPCDTYALHIFNRWGESVFITDNPFTDSWDGRYNGRPAPDGLYVYLLKGRHSQKQGYVLISR